MDDNATCHRTLAVQDCLDSEGIQRLVWPVRSPDLNPIENVWDALGRQVAVQNYPPTNKNTLIRALTQEWDKLPQQLLDNVVLKERSGRRGDPGQRVRLQDGRFFWQTKEGEKPRENGVYVRFKVDRNTSKRIRYGFITVKSTTLIGLNSPRKNTTLPAIRSVEPRRTHIPV
ncbi:transposable element Tcb1 transposase [Trichonephila clavipes]|nr:transposable element Tcb1 transposase [Trichonephila clavipes]